MSESLDAQQSFDPEALVGSVLDGRYRLDSIIGVGRISVVFRALHLMMNRYVAVKLLRPSVSSSQESMRHFRLEVQAVNLLGLPGMVRIHDFGLSPVGTSFLVMDLVDGVTLAAVLKEGAGLNPSRVIDIYQQCCEILSHAHRRGVFHRNLKPSNIMLASVDERQDQVRLVDFGVAKLVSDESGDWRRLTPTGELLTELSYLSPEESRGEQVDARSEIYSLGCVMHEVLNGNSSSREQFLIDIEKNAGRGGDSELAKGLQAVVLKSMEKDPDHRYQSASEVIAALNRLKEDGTGSNRLPTRRIVWLVSLFALVVMIYLGCWLTWNGGDGLARARLVNWYIGATAARNAPRYLDSSISLASEELRAGHAAEAIKILNGIELDVAQTFQNPSFQSTEVGILLAKAYRKVGDEEMARRRFELTSRQLGELSFNQCRTGKAEQGVRNCERRLELQREFCAANSIELADAVLGMEEACWTAHQEARALQLIEDELKNLTGDTAKKRDARQWLLSDQAGLLRSAKRFAEAEKLYEKVIEERTFLFGDTHPWTTGSIRELGRLFVETKQLDRAERLFRRAAANDKLRQRSEVLDDLCLLGDLRFSREDRAGAYEFYLQALKASEMVKKRDREHYINFLRVYKGFLHRDGREQEAAEVGKLISAEAK